MGSGGLPAFGADALRLLARCLSEDAPEWKLWQRPTLAGAEFTHKGGQSAALVILQVHKPLGKTETSRHLRHLSQATKGSGKLLILYSHAGFAAESARAVTNRVANRVALIGPLREADRYRVADHATSESMTPAEAALVALCRRVIESAVFGSTSSAHGELGFESFSLDPAGVVAISFMTERECGRRRRELVRGAEKTVLLTTYNFDDADLAELLVEKASAVSVTCVLSDAVQLKRNPRMAERLRQGGVQVKVVNSHAKCLVVDGSRVLLGSANASNAKSQGLEFNIELHSVEFATRIQAFLDHRLAKQREVEGLG